MGIKTQHFVKWVGLLSLVLWGSATSAQAYVGPGAGFAVVTSFFVLFISFFLAFVFIGLGLLRGFIRLFRRSRGAAKGAAKRVVILGFDGLDPRFTQELIDQGQLPNMAALAEEGCFRPLRTTTPSMSPVAWSSFSTGCNPGKHNIFDFLAPDRRTYLPTLSSAQVGGPRRRLALGRFALPLSRPMLRLLRRSKPFWKVLGEQGIFSTILRVPITFPPEKFRGLLLSGMCVPDLRGSQGHSFFYTTDEGKTGATTGGDRILVAVDGDRIETCLEGPENPIARGRERLRLPFQILLYRELQRAEIILPGQKIALRPGEFSPWVRLAFPAGWGVKVKGLCRFYLTSLEPHLGLYVSPIHIDPESPALPISHPFSYSIYLAKLLGPYATLGLAEDTWALNQGALDDQSFLRQCYDNHEEREKMFWDALEKTLEGACVCVFDLSDRVQHMFWGRVHGRNGTVPPEEVKRSREVLTQVYQTLDSLVGRVQARVDGETVLMVMSDHGFSTFERGLNLNVWLARNGYLALQDGSAEGSWCEQVDWKRTKAYALGLGGIFFNVQGREKQGIVAPGREVRELKQELQEKLTGLRDEEAGEVAIEEVFDSAQVYSGPYLDRAPELIVGCAPGYRVSWEAVTGGIGESVFEDNPERWAADHCVHPARVPGVFLCNRPLKNSNPSITDVAPTVLSLLGVPVPSYMDGRPLIETVPEEKTEP